MNTKFGFCSVLVFVVILAQSVFGETLTARQAVDRTDPVASVWATDVKLIFIGTLIEPGVYADGKADGWVCGYYSASKDSARNFYTLAIGPVSTEPEPKEGYPSLQPIGSSWRDSDAASAGAEAQTGRFFRQNHPDVTLMASLSWNAGGPHDGFVEWGLWWDYTYYSPSAQSIIKLKLSGTGTWIPPSRTFVTTDPILPNQDMGLGGSGTLNFSGAIPDSVRVDTYAGMSPDTTGVKKAVLRYFQITAYPEDRAYDATLTLSYSQEEFDLSGIADESGLKLYRDSGAGWELVGGTSNPDENSVTVSGVSGFSAWAISSPDDLPLWVETSAGRGPERFVLEQNYPNPFNPSTTIRFLLPGRAHVTLKVFDLKGREAAMLVDSVMPAGEYTARFDASGLPSGIYVARIRMGDFTAARLMAVVK